MKSELIEELRKRDRELVQIVDAATAEAVRRSGAWVVCRPGCFQCCLGPFPITPLDAMRLRDGLAKLEHVDAQRAKRVRHRVAEYIASMPEVADCDALDDAPCPALDPVTHCCDLYEWRPLTCRTFGAAALQEDGSVAACELCYEGVSAEQIAACVVETDPSGLEAGLLGELEATGVGGATTVAIALLQSQCVIE